MSRGRARKGGEGEGGTGGRSRILPMRVRAQKKPRHERTWAARRKVRRVWRVDFGVMEWGVVRAAIPLGCCVVGVESRNLTWLDKEETKSNRAQKIL